MKLGGSPNSKINFLGGIYMWRFVAITLTAFAIWLVFWLEGDDKWNL